MMNKYIKRKEHIFNRKPEIYEFSLDSRYYKFRQKLNRSPWKVLYKGILPKGIRKAIDYRIDLYQQEYVEKCWNRIIEEYLRDKETGKVEMLSSGIVPKREIRNKKIIWQYWGTGWEEEKIPDIVRLCMKSVEKYSEGYTVIRLDDENLGNYIELPEFIYKKKKSEKIPFAFFADILRLALLNAYGGVWLDATILLTGHFSEEYMEDEYFMFQRSLNVESRKYWEKQNKDYFSWDNRHKVKVLNSIIFSRKGNKVIKTLLDLLLIFWKKEDKVPHYFFFQILYTVLIDRYMQEFRCRIIDDTLPHILFSKWNDRFNEEEYRELTERINMHKLTYKMVEGKGCREGTFYDYFMKRYGS